MDRETTRQPGGWLMRVALLALLPGAAVPAGAQSVSEDFDRISGERTIAYSADGSRDSARPALTFNASFVGELRAAVISLAVVSGAEAPDGARSRFAACHNLDWFVDGRPLPASSASHRGDIVDGEMIELIDQDVTPSWVTAIGAARSVRYRLCRDEYALTPGDIDALASIAAKLKSAGLSSPVRQADAPAAAAATEVEYKGMNWRPKHAQSLFPSRD